MKFTKSAGIIAFAAMTLSVAATANPYPYHSGIYKYSDDDVVTTTQNRSYSDDDVTTIRKSDDDVTNITKSYSDNDVTKISKSYSDDDVTKITKSYSDDDVTNIRKDQRSSWESNYTSNWSNTDERFKSSVTANDKTHQDSGHKADSSVSGKAKGHSNQTTGATTFMNIGGLGNPVRNSGVYINNADQNTNQFGSNLSSMQAGGDQGDRIVSIGDVGNTNGSANGSVSTNGTSGIGQYGNTGLNNQKSVSSAATK